VLGGTNPVQVAAGLAVFTNLSIDLPGTGYRLDFDGGSLATLTSALFDVAGVPTLLGIGTQPGGATAGSAFVTQPVVEVRDAAGAVVSSDNATQVTAAITSGAGTTSAVLSGTLTIVVVNGIANFSGLAIDLAGSGYTLTFTSTPALTPVNSVAFSVASTATQLSIDTQPGQAGPATAFLQQPVVSIRDAGGAVVTADNTTQVTATITSGTGATGAVIGGTTTVTAINGVATFTNLAIDLTGTGYTLTFTSTPALTPTVSSAFNVENATSGGGGKKKKKGDEGCTTGEEQSWLLLAASLALAVATMRKMRRRAVQ
jgi:hypothetical protein